MAQEGIVKDVSGRAQNLDLQIANPQAVQSDNDGLQVLSPTLVSTKGPATSLREAVRQTGAITIEAWIRPANVRQNGPARIISMSQNSTQGDFTLGQDGDKIEVRLRTTRASTNGKPPYSLDGNRTRPSRLIRGSLLGVH